MWRFLYDHHIILEITGPDGGNKLATIIAAIGSLLIIVVALLTEGRIDNEEWPFIIISLAVVVIIYLAARPWTRPPE